MTDIAQIWAQIIRLHQCSKELFIVAEELDPNFKSFLQPSQELKHAYEHITRAQAAGYGLVEEEISDDYVEKNLSKALGHEYRAFFDSADWIGINLRKRISALMTPYSNACITAVFPEYFTSIKPEIERINKEISIIRNNKDVTKKNHVLLLEVEQYQKTINDLLDSIVRISYRIPALEEYKKREHVETRKVNQKIAAWNYKSYLVAAIIALLAAVASCLLTIYFYPPS